MTIADVAATVTMRPEVRNRILILDVERLDGITQQHYWDRGDLQKRYVHHETVIREPRTTIVCAKWYDQPEVMRFAEWDKGGRGQFLKRVHRLMSQADVIVGHNLDNADIPWLQGDFYFPRIGHPHRPRLSTLPPFKTVDTLKVLRSFKSGVPFKSLAAFNQINGLPGKTDSYDRQAMERAVAGSVEDQVRETDYCEGDVVATQWTYDYLRPHIKNHPALFVDGEHAMNVCNRCGESETLPCARRYVANVLTYQMLKCARCLSYRRLSIEPERMSMVRGV